MKRSIRNYIVPLRRIGSKHHLNHRTLADISAQMAEMLHAGVDLKLIFFALERSVDGRRILYHRQWQQMLEEGADISEVFAMYRFPTMFVNTVKAGEKSGQLAESLLLLSEYHGRIADFKSKARQAVIYPTVILFTVLFSLYFMMNFVLPNFRNLYQGMGLSIPEYTQRLFHLQEWLDEYKVWMGTIAVVTVVLIYLVGRSMAARSFLLWCGLLLPGVAKYVRYYNTYLVVSQMSMLTRGGISIREAFVSIRQLFSGTIAKRIELMSKRVLAGAMLSESLRATGCFDQQLVHFVEMGETTGRLAASFATAEVYYNQKVKRLLVFFIKGIEPVALLMAGMFVLFMMLAMLLPIFNLMETM